MTIRISGMATGLDIDSIVKDSMKPYQLRIDNERKQKQIMQWKQEQYQSIMKDVTAFYNKYLTVDGKNSLYSSSAYNQTKFTSANENVVSVTGSSDASISDYKVSVTQLAKKASTKVTKSELDNLLIDTTESYDVDTQFGGQRISFSAKIGDTANNIDAFKKAVENKETELENSKIGKSDSDIKEIQQQIDKLKEASTKYTEENYKNMINGLKVTTNNGLSVNVTGTSDNSQMKLVVNLGGKVDYSATAENYNANSKKANVTARYSEISGGVVFESNNEGKGDFVVSGFSDGTTKTGTAQKLHATISNGTDVFKIDDTTNTEYNSSNRVSLDGMTFTFKDVTLKTNADGTYQKAGGGITTNPDEAVNEPSKITGSKDVTVLKDRIKSFVDDYNALLLKINTKIFETYDKSYQPLTEDEKSAMSESQIEKWEKKAQTGLLRNDDNFVNLAESMKDAMATFMTSSKIDVESLGIKPMANEWKEKNGIYEIDEDKLTKALQENFDGVKELFFKNPTATDTANSGIIPKLRKIMDDNVVKFDSVFNKKAGGGTYILTNDMTKELQEKTKLIKEMNASLKTKQDALYKKYSKLEKAMAKAQSQQSSMATWFSN
ncbi:MAG: hypothetical protein E7207_02665 [Clostridium butyricum]|nr:hypothetical protein [Clostridium butyricum]